MPAAPRNPRTAAQRSIMSMVWSILTIAAWSSLTASSNISTRCWSHTICHLLQSVIPTVSLFYPSIYVCTDTHPQHRLFKIDIPLISILDIAAFPHAAPVQSLSPECTAALLCPICGGLQALHSPQSSPQLHKRRRPGAAHEVVPNEILHVGLNFFPGPFRDIEGFLQRTEHATKHDDSPTGLIAPLRPSACTERERERREEGERERESERRERESECAYSWRSPDRPSQEEQRRVLNSCSIT